METENCVFWKAMNNRHVEDGCPRMDSCMEAPYKIHKLKLTKFKNLNRWLEILK